jgi:hypothetical protein
LEYAIVARVEHLQQLFTQIGLLGELAVYSEASLRVVADTDVRMSWTVL